MLHRRQQRNAKASRRGPVIVGLTLASVVAGAQAAEVVDVRVAAHRGFTRIVLETDAPILYRIEPAAEPGEALSDELRVWLDAKSGSGSVTWRGAGQPSVWLEPRPEGGSLARVPLDAPIVLQQQVLQDPDRLVLDLWKPAAAAGSPKRAPQRAAGIESLPVAVEPADPIAGASKAPGDAQPATPARVAGELESTPMRPPPDVAAAPPPEDTLGPFEVLMAFMALVVPITLMIWARRRSLEPAAKPTPLPPAAKPAPSSQIPQAADVPFATADPETPGAPPSPAPREPARPVAPARASTAQAEAPAEPPGVSAPPLHDPADDALVRDLLSMIQRLDARVAELEGELTRLADGHQLASAQSAAYNEELKVHRVALARFQRLLRGPSQPSPPDPSRG